MKKSVLFFAFGFLINFISEAQVTQINNNKSLAPIALLNPNLAVAISSIDHTLWATNGTLAGTIQLSSTITSTGGVVFNGKYIFLGSTTATGDEIYVTDGTPAGTKLIKDIYPGTTGSKPDDDMTIMNGYVYFTAETAGEGRELWKTDGSVGNATQVKDIIPGAAGSNDPESYELTSAGNYLLLDVKTAANGNELWRSDGTAGGTFLLKDIVPNAPSSNPRFFYPFNNMMLFTVTAADGVHAEIWRTNGTLAGTIPLKTNINAGLAGVANYNTFFHIFKNRAYFLINDGTNTGAIWSTDGVDATSAHTSFLKDVGIDAMYSSALFLDAVNLSNKFIVPISDLSGITDRNELWESDGTNAGTKVFKSFPPNANSNIPLIYANRGYNSATQTITYPLYKGNFFFTANSATEGNELWISDGNPDPAHTHIVKDINPRLNDGIDNNVTYFYTTAGLFFGANDGTHGNELWKTDGTVGGTSLVKDINPLTGDADPDLDFIVNGKILFTAFDGDDATNMDLFVIDGMFEALPVKLLEFTVTPKASDALLQWSTAQEINSKDFTVQSSVDAQSWNNLGTVPAAGNSSARINYSFIDVNVMKSGKSIVYYRLVSTDINGKPQYSDIIPLKINGGNHWDVQVFSNPVQDNLKVLLSGANGMSALSVTDITGKTLYKKQIQNQNGLISIPVNLQRGVYILVAENKNEKRSIKFIKE